MLRNPSAYASLQEGIAQVGRGDVVRYEPGHFSRLAEEMGIGVDDEEDAD